jgi:surface antigen Omp85-like protein
MKHIHPQIRFLAAIATSALALFLTPHLTRGQSAKRTQGKDSVVVVASDKYQAGSFHRWLWGDNWRDVWATPIKVEVLDLKTFAGGLKPTETGGNQQTTSLRFMGGDGVEYQFRPVYKDRLAAIKPYEHTIIASIFRDGLSALHPTGPLAVPPVLDAAGVLHPTPILYVMPNDPALGEFRKEFAGKLGAIEERGLMPKEGLGLGGAIDIIESDDLLKHLNKDPSQRVNARAFLTARLIDVFLNDNDRHRYQWRWAHVPPRLAGSTAADDVLWVPISRDRDAVFLHHQGLTMKVLRHVQPNLVAFEGQYPRVAAQQTAALELDQRLLVGLDRAAWDSISIWLRTRITDAVIDSAVRRMPREYAASSSDIAAKLRSRRDKLGEAAAEYYRFLAEIPEIHAPDSDDRVTITREGRDVIVQIQTGDRAPWFERRFVAGETRELRVYLHGGADKAIVRGDGNEGIFLRVIGGNGDNTLIDSSTVNGRHRLTRLYDNGSVNDIEYGKDTTFNRRPWIKAYGKWIPPVKDRGWRTGPTADIGSGAGLGIVGKIGFERKHYGFRYAPYKSRTSLDLEYATGVNGFRAAFESDRRVESTQLHYMFDAEATQLNIVEFRGFGNTVEDSDDLFFDVKQLQLIVRPSIGLALGPIGDLSLGPIVKYAIADSLENRFISEEHPLGFPRFGQAGGQLALKQDTRDSAWTRGVFLRASASYYPQVWDVKKPFGEVSALASTYFTFPILTRPTLALRGGAKKVFGDFPFYEAAFVGGRTSLRAMHRQRFAGDASLHGTTELRVPIARVNYILPWSFGAIGFMEAGRVYLNGESQGTWHSARGVGGWIGLLGPKTAVHIVRTNRADRRIVVGLGFAF